MATSAAHLPWCASKQKGCWCESQRYAIVLVLGLCTLGIQLAGGYVSHSLALYADSAHVASDAGGSLLSLYVAIRVRSHKEEERIRVYYARVNALILLVILAGIAYAAVERLQHPSEVHGLIAAAVACIGLFLNIAQLRVLRTERTVTAHIQRWHIVQDVGSSIAVIFGLFAVWAFGWTIIDPVLSLVIVLVTGIPAIQILAGAHHPPHNHTH